MYGSIVELEVSIKYIGTYNAISYNMWDYDTRGNENLPGIYIAPDGFKLQYKDSQLSMDDINGLVTKQITVETGYIGSFIIDNNGLYNNTKVDYTVANSVYYTPTLNTETWEWNIPPSGLSATSYNLMCTRLSYEGLSFNLMYSGDTSIEKSQFGAQYECTNICFNNETFIHFSNQKITINKNMECESVYFNDCISIRNTLYSANAIIRNITTQSIITQYINNATPITSSNIGSQSVKYSETSHGIRSYNSGGGSHGESYIIRAQWYRDGDDYFKLYCNEGNQVKVDYASSAGSAPANGGTANYANSAGSAPANGGTATNAEYCSNDSAYMRFHWSGQGGQPAWLWGGNDPNNMYVWSPSNFNVNYANSASSASSATYASSCVCGGISSNTGVYSGNGDNGGYGVANLFIQSWWGVGFVDGCTGRGMTASVDCRNGNIYAAGLLQSAGSFNTTTSAGANAHIANGNYTYSIYRSTSSSARYKHDIEYANIEELKCLYNVPIHTFKYNLDYLTNTDERYGKDIYGFIAEELDAIMPIAVNHNDDGTAEMWNNNILVPCLLGLIQDLHKRIQNLEGGN